MNTTITEKSFLASLLGSIKEWLKEWIRTEIIADGYEDESGFHYGKLPAKS